MLSRSLEVVANGHEDMRPSRSEWKQSLRFSLLFNGLLSHTVWVRLWWVYSSLYISHIASIPSLLKDISSMCFQAFQSQLTNWKVSSIMVTLWRTRPRSWLDRCSGLLSVSRLFLFTVTCPTTGSAAWLQICSRDSPTSPNCKPLSIDSDIYWWTKTTRTAISPELLSSLGMTPTFLRLCVCVSGTSRETSSHRWSRTSSRSFPRWSWCEWERSGNLLKLFCSINTKMKPKCVVGV